jgi:hypothetical protein
MTDFSSLVNFTGDLHGIAALAAARSLNLEKQASSPCFLNRDDRFFSRREHTLRVAPTFLAIHPQSAEGAKCDFKPFGEGLRGSGTKGRNSTSGETLTLCAGHRELI